MNAYISAAWAKVHSMIKGLIALLPNILLAICYHCRYTDNIAATGTIMLP